MDTYSFLRQLADSWVLLAMALFYLTAILWAFRPSAKNIHKELASLPLRDDSVLDPCANNCEDCSCKKLVPELKK